MRDLGGCGRKGIEIGAVSAVMADVYKTINCNCADGLNSEKPSDFLCNGAVALK